MRKTSALAAARRLSELTESAPDAGFRLQDLVGFGPAKNTAIGIVDDLAAGSKGELH